jgi:hypothetical protein
MEETMSNQQNKSPPQYTQGPWEAYNTANTPESRFMVGKYWPQAGAYQRIADCSYEATSGASGDEALANARLIATAPELVSEAIADSLLLEAAAERLNEITDNMEGWGIQETKKALADLRYSLASRDSYLRGIISKATGGAA